MAPYLQHHGTFVVSFEIVIIIVTEFFRQENFGESPRTDRLFNIEYFIATYKRKQEK